MNILVTGVAGFIGSNYLHYYLEKNKEDKIIGIDKLTYAGNVNNFKKLTKEQKERVTFYRADINNRELIDNIFSKKKIDKVINFAAESHVDRSIEEPQVFLKTNILGTQTLLEVSKQHWYNKNEWKEEKKYIQISTDEVYGALGKEGVFTEKTPIDPHSPYSASKAGADLIVQAYHDTYGMPVNITRCSNNYGPYQFPEKLIPLIIMKAKRKEKLPVYGDGKQIRDWIHVKEHCEAIELVMKKGKEGQVYNIGGKNEKENIEVVKTIINYLQEKTKDRDINEELIEHVEDRLGHDRRYAIDPTKIKEELGWEPKIRFEEGIKETIEWYIENEQWLEEIRTKEYLKHNKNYNEVLKN